MHLVAASVLYAAALAASFQTVELLNGNQFGQPGPNVTAWEAAIFVSILLFIAGAFAMVLVLSPLSLLLARLGLSSYSLNMLVAMLAGTFPLAALTWGPKGGFGQGLETSSWFPDPVIFFAFAGCIGGLYLWITWFRHLTARW
jgi:hypothetical protein